MSRLSLQQPTQQETSATPISGANPTLTSVSAPTTASGASGTPSNTSSPAVRTPEIHGMILVIVFAGGTIGTALRYAFAQIPAIGADGGFHTGTLAANLLACFCYAGLSAFLAGSSRISARHKEFASRGLGMGLCGGLSTMSTLALEGFTSIRGGDTATGILYLVVTFALGLACAWMGATAGAALAARNGDNNTQHNSIRRNNKED